MSTISLPPLLPGRVVEDADVALGYATDRSLGSTAPEEYVVVRARDRADVVAVLEHAQAHRVPVVPQGARSSLCGGSTAIAGGIVLNVEALQRLEIDRAERYATVGPGVVTADLKQAAASEGLAYPPDPASSPFCTIGGNVATNAGGLCCVKYGVTAGYVLGLEVVLAGGEVIRTGRRTAKGVAGLDLTGLFVGSEGQLGVVTEAVLRLVPASDPPLTALATFASLADATRGLLALRNDRHGPNLLEVLDGPSLRAIQAMQDFGFPEDAAAALLVQSDRPGSTDADVRRYAELLSDAGADAVAVADDEQEAEALMAGRRALAPAPERKGSHFIEDVCVPVSRLGDLIAAAHEVGDRTGVDITLSGHGGDGNLHPCLFFDDSPGSRERAEGAFADLVDVALRMGGTITGEHGVGTLKRRWLPRELGEAELARQRAVKAVFDPLGIMNPGRPL
ncbi:FAD-linked oxidase C-terminal domain-containing protein [Luteipulveratus sp. YIM 133132]|uniref:FAD-binding oxidoreductase n=1 Tax=Luteipulveratus flavus TaxID=3031728 RepID=UPI0023AEB1E6|nr:FAD-linked oxidase C-terminal domain-containing protein [Luteipulveratus sp. YIM 133132]MDE9366264.1 FAD-linked oxidase C-terminal domain-containing protein [Luteipulveratus sp. YIM 133132]